MAGRNADRQEIFFVENCSVAGHNSNELDTASFYVTMTDDEKKKYQHFVKKRLTWYSRYSIHLSNPNDNFDVGILQRRKKPNSSFKIAFSLP